MADSDLVFIIGRQRSGTTVFRRLLRSAGAMDCDEVFHGNLAKEHRFYRYVHKRAEKDRSLVHPLRHGALFADFVKELRQEADGRKLAMDVKYFALNLFPSREDVSTEYPQIVNFMRNHEAHVVHVVRRNKLRLFVSEEISRAMDVWGVHRQGAVPANKPRLTIPPKKARLFIKRQIRNDNVVAKMLENIPTARRLDYEDMFRADGRFAEPTMEIARACMGVTELSDEPEQIRMNPEAIRDLVDNYDDLVEVLQDTPHTWMLTAD